MIKHKNKTREECYEQIKHLFGQHDNKIIDSDGKRWFECVCCGKRARMGAFMTYNTDGKLNSGVCILCYYQGFDGR